MTGQHPASSHPREHPSASIRPASIRTESFGWHYPHREDPAFCDLTVEIPAGQKVLLLGPSGAGKSTFLHALAGVLDQEDDPATGTALIDGIPAAQARGRVGLMQQDPEASIVLSRVGQDLAFGPENLGVPREQIRPRCEEALAAVGLDLPWDRPASALSGGQKQRLGLAGILAMRPGLLLLDEPTANLDPEGVEEVRDAVVQAAAAYGSTLIVVEHRVSVWAPQMDRVIVLRSGGGLSHDGAPERVLREARQELIDAGVWVPDHHPAWPSAEGDGAGEGRAGEGRAGGVVLLEARDLGVTRTPPERAWVRARRRAAAAQPEPPTHTAALDGTALDSTDLNSADLNSADLGQSPWAREAEVAARDIGLSLRSGEHLAVLGPNGAGKSTLALTLAGLQWPAEGIVAASPELREIAELREEAGLRASAGQQGVGQRSRSRQRRWLRRRRAGRDEHSWDPMLWSSQTLIRRIGTVFQEPEHQFVRATVAEELELGARLAGFDDPQARADRLLDRLRLTHVAEANPFTLSGGEKRRLSVGTALAARPRVLVLDEPTFGQDAITWARLVHLLRELMDEGTAVVSVTHDLDFAEALGGQRIDLGQVEYRTQEV